MIRPRIKHLRSFLAVLHKKHDEVLLAKGSPIGKGWRTNALPFNTSLRKKKKFRKVTQARYRPEHKLFATMMRLCYYGFDFKKSSLIWVSIYLLFSYQADEFITIAFKLIVATAIAICYVLCKGLL